MFAAVGSSCAESDETFGAITMFTDGRVGKIPDSPVTKIFLRDDRGVLIKTVPAKCTQQNTYSMTEQHGADNPAVVVLKTAIEKSKGVLRDIFMVCTAAEEMPMKKQTTEHYSGGSQSRDYLMIAPADSTSFSFGGYDYFLYAPDRKSFAIIVGHEKLMKKN